MQATNYPTRETATPDQLASGEYEVDGVMGGQGRSPEKLIADAEAGCMGMTILLLVIGIGGVVALVRALF